MSKKAKLVLCAVETSIIINYPNHKYFKINMNKVCIYRYN